MLNATRAWIQGLPQAVTADVREMGQGVVDLWRNQQAPMASTEAPHSVADINLQRQESLASDARRPRLETPHQHAEEDPPVWMTKRELAEFLRVSISSIERYQRLDGLPAHFVGGVRRYPAGRG